MRNWQESGVVEEDNQGLDHHGAANTNNWSTQQTSSSATKPQQRQEQQSLHISQSLHTDHQLTRHQINHQSDQLPIPLEGGVTLVVCQKSEGPWLRRWRAAFSQTMQIIGRGRP